MAAIADAKGTHGYGQCACCLKQGHFTWYPRPPPGKLRLDLERGREKIAQLCTTCSRENKLALVREENAQKDQDDPLLRVQPRKKGERPKMVICSICGKQFTFASLVQHEKRCVASWERDQAELPKSMRAPGGHPPLASVTMRQAQGKVEAELAEEGLNASVLEGAKLDARRKQALEAALEAATEEAWQDAQQALTGCPNGCGRTFLPDRVGSHLPRCLKERGDQVHDPGARAQYGLGKRKKGTGGRGGKEGKCANDANEGDDPKSPVGEVSGPGAGSGLGPELEALFAEHLLLDDRGLVRALAAELEPLHGGAPTLAGARALLCAPGTSAEAAQERLRAQHGVADLKVRKLVAVLRGEGDAEFPSGSPSRPPSRPASRPPSRSSAGGKGRSRAVRGANSGVGNRPKASGGGGGGGVPSYMASTTASKSTAEASRGVRVKQDDRKAGGDAARSTLKR